MGVSEKHPTCWVLSCTYFEYLIWPVALFALVTTLRWCLTTSVRDVSFLRIDFISCLLRSSDCSWFFTAFRATFNTSRSASIWWCWTSCASICLSPADFCILLPLLSVVLSELKVQSRCNSPHCTPHGINSWPASAVGPFCKMWKLCSHILRPSGFHPIGTSSAASSSESFSIAVRVGQMEEILLTLPPAKRQHWIAVLLWLGRATLRI